MEAEKKLPKKRKFSTETGADVSSLPHDKNDSDKIIHNQLGLEVETPEWSNKFFFFLLFYTIKEICLVFMELFGLTYTESAALCMKFPTRAIYITVLSDVILW